MMRNRVLAAAVALLCAGACASAKPEPDKPLHAPRNVDEVTGIWRTANWHERETYDLFGVIFDNHPDLRRILLPDDWQGHALRKDFPLRGYEPYSLE